MSNLNEYLAQKRQALITRREQAEANGTDPHTLRATANVEGRSGVRRIRIRDFQIISDSGPDFAGYDLGPTSPELQLGVLGSCLSHVFLIQAAQREVPLNALDVEVTAQIDARSGQPGYENVPVYPHNISYTVHIDSPASAEEIAALHDAVERACPILNLLINPQQIHGELVHTTDKEIANDA
ncbi:osmotically inducible protein OsmC [Dictyobacter alpinus]|uniref:Osmotically inducible protein OsmC n=1 Tax=Dictyobacter alpinus TaxID=2014873 RepID=A0A402B1D0_9CHLR|nr:OsmC family protein [Dictyobacter alpinus]GCE25170.1 osmotically inducible protein OsmC [Dictyobacter alpinus]